MQLQLTLTGTSPLLMKNQQGVDPDHPITKEIAAITSKRKKTEDDRREVSRLEWNLSLYLDEDGQIVVPTANVKRCLIESGKINRQGTAVARAMAPLSVEEPLSHNGVDKDLDNLVNDANYVDKRSVGIGAKRVMRTRPRFYPWELTIVVELFEDILDLDDFKRIAERAGTSIGLGDNRVNGFGRFEIEVEQV